MNYFCLVQYGFIRCRVTEGGQKRNLLKMFRLLVRYRRRREEEDYRRRMEGGAGGLLDTARRNALGAGLTGSLGGLSGAGGGQPGRGGGWNTGPPQVPPPYQR